MYWYVHGQHIMYWYIKYLPVLDLGCYVICYRLNQDVMCYPNTCTSICPRPNFGPVTFQLARIWATHLALST